MPWRSTRQTGVPSGRYNVANGPRLNHDLGDATLSLEEMGARLRALVRNAPIIHFAIDAQGLVSVSEGRGLEAMGVAPGEVVGRSIFELYAAKEWVVDSVRRALAGEAVSVVGQARGRWYSVQYVPLPGPAGGAIGFAVDVTAQKEAEERLRESEERFRSLSEASFEAIAIHDQGRILVANRAMADLFGYDDPAELVGRNALEMTAPESRSVVVQHIREGYEEPYEATGLRKDRSTFAGELHAKTIRFQDRDVRVTAIRDITERKLAEAQLRHAALHDPLTGLPNRALFLDRLGHVLAQSREGEALFGVLLLDIDRFKTVNDSLGHFVGDRLLSSIAMRLLGALRASDTLARFGGDEFTILLEDLEDASEVVKVAERVQEVLASPLRVDSYEIVTSASIGIVVAPVSSYAHAERVLRDADTAMYRAKAEGRARYQLFDEAMHTRVSGLLQLESDLRHAASRDELHLYYQPIVRLSDRKTVALEALMRWQHPRQGLLLPDAFLGLAEETGLIVSLGPWTVREACRAVATLRTALGRPRPPLVAVNLSARQLFHHDFAGRVRGILAEADVHGALLQMEVTEGVLIEDADAAVALLLELRDMGVSLSIDDFGTGYSSLSQLHRLPVGILKLDRSFVQAMSGAGSRELVRTIVALGHNLGMQVTAEGIETEAQLVDLAAMGCDYGQGYLFAAAVPLDEVIERLRRE
jgi:diguanylate cyclase (GGDEF)-like protein/PAS domain S-box-containing protein